ncbi:protein ANTI-SILENCING 1 isoform X2 [Primulina tabacum]|uniref:protein ANTI-SILENCING 1 isoform X2 n=1 Tax=Primulina tabacum TaxID=48773 RepID=UPI003F5AA2DD
MSSGLTEDSGLTEEKIEEPEFRWIKKKGVGSKNKNVQFYESFVYDGEEYHLYDSVYMYKQGEPPYIGKLVKIWEYSEATKRVKVHWFFRPREISNHLGDTVTLENELFLASGDGDGLANVNPLEAIAGKCNVICISRDRRNRQPTAEELQMANYVYYRSFDVKSLTISDQLNDTVGGIQVKFVFNSKESFKTIEVTAGGEIPMLAGKNTPEQLKNLTPDENSDHTVEKKEVRDVKRLQTKRESLHGETKGVSSSKEAASGGSYLDARVNSSKDEEAMETDEKLKVLGSKDVGCKVKPLVIQAQFEEGMKSARKSGDIDEKPSKRVRIDDMVTLAKDQCTNGVQNSTVPRNDAMSPVTRVVSSNTQAKVELDDSFVGPGNEDSKLAGKSLKGSIEMMNPLLKTDAYSSNKKSSVGHDVDHEKSFVGNTNDSTMTKDLRPSVEKSLRIAKLNDSPENNKDKSSPKSIKIKRPTSEIKQSPSEMKKSNTHVPMKEDKNKSRLPKTLDKGKDRKVDGQIFEATRRPIAEKSKWFKELPWEQRMKTSHDEGTLVLFQNLDPEFTSGEVEDIVFHAFEEICAARMVQHTAISNPHYGQAFAIFKTREAAERIVKELDDGCLMLPNNRPLIGGIAVLPNLSEKHTTFVGHFAIDKVRRQVQRDMKEAVSTSHYSQTNTIEYEMAMSWCLLQSKADRWWIKLYEQNVNLKKLTSDLKSK